MKLLSRSLLYLSIPIFIVVSIWAVFFYYSMLREIYDSIDDGLDNYKLLIIQKAGRDSSILSKTDFDESNYAIRKIYSPYVPGEEDTYKDTLMYMLNEEEMEPVRMLTTTFKYRKQHYELKVISSMVEEDDQVRNLFWASIWLYILLLASITLIDEIVLQRLWKPFYDFLEQLKGFRIDQGINLPEMDTKTKEFVELKKATHSLIDRIRETYYHQRQFIGNAAHELQTPLAIITNKLELLMEKGKLDDEDAKTIAEVMQTTSRLKQLNRSLLLLSKIENKQFFDNQQLSLNQLVHQVVAELEDYRVFKAIALAAEEQAQVDVIMDSHLAYILVSNLVKNAIFHNAGNGQVWLLITKNALMVENTSSGGELDEQQMYRRFYRATSKKKSTGLGLPIIQAICNLYGFTISYSYQGTHSFKITFS